MSGSREVVRCVSCEVAQHRNKTSSVIVDVSDDTWKHSHCCVSDASPACH